MSVKAATAIDKGVRLLDEKIPGWRDEIDWKELDIQFIDKCILGQLAGAHYGEEILDILGFTSWEDSAEYGFDVPNPLRWVDTNYGILTRMWFTWAVINGLATYED